MFFIQLISDQDWHKLDFILTIVISTITAGFVVWRILVSNINKKADKEDLIKLETDMTAKVQRVEERNKADNKLMRDDMFKFLESMDDKIKMIYNWTNPKKK